jgi:hypothetical protein
MRTLGLGVSICVNPRVGERRRPCHLWNPRSESVTTMPHLICCSCLLLAHSFGKFFNIIDALFVGNWCLLLEPLTLLQKSLNLITRLLRCYHLVLPICVVVQLYLKLWEIQISNVGMLNQFFYFLYFSHKLIDPAQLCWTFLTFRIQHSFKTFFFPLPIGGHIPLVKKIKRFTVRLKICSRQWDWSKG